MESPVCLNVVLRIWSRAIFFLPYLITYHPTRDLWRRTSQGARTFITKWWNPRPPRPAVTQSSSSMQSRHTPEEPHNYLHYWLIALKVTGYPFYRKSTFNEQIFCTMAVLRNAYFPCWTYCSTLLLSCSNYTYFSSNCYTTRICLDD